MNPSIPGLARAGGYRALLRQPPFGRLFWAGVTSGVGFAVAQLGLLWYVYSATHAPLTVAYMGIAGSAALLAAGFASGPILDRYDRRAVMVAADLGRSAALAGFVGSVAVWGYQFVPLMAVAVALAGLSALFTPAQETALPLLVSTTDLPGANGLIASAGSGVGIVGAAVGGLLVAGRGAEFGLMVGAATFVGSAAVLAGLPAARARPRDLVDGGPPGVFGKGLFGGFAWLGRTPGMLWLTLGSMLFNFFALIVAAFLVFYSGTLGHASPLVFGAIVSTLSAGVTVGPLLAPRLRLLEHPGTTLVVLYGIVPGATVLCLGLLPSIPVAVGGLFILGATEGMAGVTWLTAAQALVPTELQGRVFAADTVGSTALFPVAQISGGLLVGDLGADVAYAVAGSAWLVAGLAFLGCRPLRDLKVRSRGIRSATVDGRTG